MKGWSLWQPWATLAAIGEKRTETRGRRLGYRGELAIHAALTTRGIDELPGDCEGKFEDGWTYGYIGDWQASYRGRETELRNGKTGADIPMPLGVIVAVAHLVDCIPTERVESFTSYFHYVGHDPENSVLKIPDTEREYGNYGPGRFALPLARVVALPEPVPCRGAQGLWTVDAEVEAKIRAQLGAAK